MGNWNFLGGVLEEVHIHSTVVGKIWLSILFIFRMLVLGVAAEDAWMDEQEDFVCNTAQPGCRNVCYDRAFPISLIRYWVLQVIFVSSPSLVYMGHAVYQLRTLEKQRQKKRALLWKDLELVDVDLARREMKHLDQRKVNKAPLRGALLRTYVAHIVVRSVVEVAFMAGQYLIYGFQLSPLYKCDWDPCPNAVDCYISRPTEKTVFMVFMQSIAALSLSLSILEVMYLCYKKIRKVTLDFCAKKGKNVQELEDFEAQRDKVTPICSRESHKRRIQSEQNHLELIERKQSYPELRKTSFLPPQLPTQGCCSQSTSAEARSSFSNFQINSKEKSEGFYLHDSRDKNGQRKNKQPPKCLQRAAHASSLPSLHMRSPRRPKEELDSFNCAPTFEIKRSDMGSHGGTKASRETPCEKISSQPTGGSLDDCSTRSGCVSSLPSSNGKTSAASDTSSRRDTDLQI